MEYKENFINSYAEYLEVVKANSACTISGYTMEVRLFFSYTSQSKHLLEVTLNDVKEITTDDIYSYVNHLASLDISANSRARTISALRSFFEYIRKRLRLISTNPVDLVERPKIKKALPKYATVEEAISILEHISDFSRHFERDYCIITLFLNCGLRVSELVNLNVSDIDLSECSMKILGKGNKERLLYLNKACVSALRDYFATRDENDEALFMSQKNERISIRTVQGLVEKALKYAGLEDKGLSTHKLRHTAATMMYQNGTDIFLLSEILGHENVNTTKIYTHIGDNQKKEAMLTSPLANVEKNS